MALPSRQPTLPADVQSALDRGEFLLAIKLLRQSTGLGLAEAKAAVDRLRQRAAATKAPGETRADTRSPVDAARKADTSVAPQAFGPLAPGEVPRTSTRFWLVVVVAAIVYLLWRLLRSAPQ